MQLLATFHQRTLKNRIQDTSEIQLVPRSALLLVMFFCFCARQILEKLQEINLQTVIILDDVKICLHYVDNFKSRACVSHPIDYLIPIKNGTLH